MDAYETLRKQATHKRDAIIRAARIEFRQSLRRINELERRLAGEHTVKATRAKSRPIIELIADLVPKDRTFTQAEVIEAMREAEPGRVFNIGTIRATFQKLELQGMIRRVRRGQSGVLWAAAGHDEPLTPYGTQSLVSVAEAVLRESGPMKAVELVVAMRERGYRTEDEPRKLLNSLAFALKRNPQTFKLEAGKWAVS